MSDFVPRPTGLLTEVGELGALMLALVLLGYFIHLVLGRGGVVDRLRNGKRSGRKKDGS